MNSVFNPFGDDVASELLGTIKHLDVEVLLSQLEEPVLMRLAMMSTKQLCDLRGVGPVTAKRIQNKLMSRFILTPHLDNQTSANWLLRNFDMKVRDLSVRLLYQINVFWPAYANVNETSMEYAVVHILAALGRDDMTMGELADYNIGELDNMVRHYFFENNYEVSAYIGSLQNIMNLSTDLRQWGVSSRVGQTDADLRVGASGLALAK